MVIIRNAFLKCLILGIAAIENFCREKEGPSLESETGKDK